MHKETVDQLVRIIEDIAAGKYSNSIMEFTREEQPEVIRRVAEAVGLMMVRVEARELRLQQLVDELKQLNERLKENIIQTVTAIANALGARDAYTRGHAVRVGEYARRLALRLGLPPLEVEQIRVAGILHDVGKIGLSDRVFSALDVKASEELRQEIHTHPAVGVQILDGLEFLSPALTYVLYHHERLDGRGYPKGIAGPEIPLGAQIISVADTYDAITTDRPYKKGKSPAEAIGILRDISGSCLDEALVEAFVQELETSGRLDPGAPAG